MASKKTTKKATTKRAPARKAVTKKASTAAPIDERTKYFTASWCPPCQAMHRMLDKHPELAARLEVIDVDEQAALADAYDVQAIPTFVTPDGRRRSGGMTAKGLAAFLDGSA